MSNDKKQFEKDIDDFFERKLEEIQKQKLTGATSTKTTRTKKSPNTVEVGAAKTAKTSNTSTTARTTSTTSASTNTATQKTTKRTERQAKEAQWAKLLDCNPGEKPWVINALFSFVEERRTAKLVKKIKNIFDQELLLCIIKETNQHPVRFAAMKNIKDKKVIETLALSNSDPNVRKAALSLVTNLEVLRKIAKSDPDKDIRKQATTLSGEPRDQDERHFFLIHDQVLKFLQAYEKSSGREYYYYHISPTFEQVYGKSEYYIEFQIKLGDWWDGIMRNHADVTNFMMSAFTFDPSGPSFTKRIRVPDSECYGRFDNIPPMIHKYLTYYEAHHSGIRLTKDDHGATYTYKSK